MKSGFLHSNTEAYSRSLSGCEPNERGRTASRLPPNSLTQLVSAYLQHKGAAVTVIILPGHILENKRKVSPSPGGDPTRMASTSASYHAPKPPPP